ncbi:MAG: stage V sporulation protein AD [Clostridia bacterium]|nr:stage V sporulation protein AD [Clostridia bacterium]
MKLMGRTITFDRPVYIKSWASAVGSKEAAGPLKSHFDLIFDDDLLGQATWEKAETELVKSAVKTALDKGSVTLPQLDLMTGGDLLNQCTASSFASRDFAVPFLGLYGACSTMAEGLLISSVFIDGGMNKALCEASSHFCSAERQYRMPIEYGSQRSPAAQWTVTGCGAVLVTDEPSAIMVTRAKIGKIVDLGVTDVSNMGAAMAPAAFDTINEFFKDTGTRPSDFDLIVTGDLAQVGRDVVTELFQKEGIDISPYYDDCGCMIFGEQDVHAGGSGCGCSASVLCSDLLRRMTDGEIKSLLFCGTGALLSPTTSNQGESIPGICHLVELRRV